MDYVALLRFRPQASVEERDQALMRRASWSYPEGIRPIAEYWPANDDVQVVTVFAADTFAPVMQLQYEWNDVFDIAISPAVSAEEGLRVGPDVLGRVTRLQTAPSIPQPSRPAPAESSTPVRA